MPSSSDTVMKTAHAILGLLIVLNLIASAAFLTILAGTFIWEEEAAAAIRRSGSNPTATLFAIRSIMALATLAIPLAHILLVRLRAMVGTVSAGDPFVSINAVRLKTIAWCLLGLQVLDLAFGAISVTFSDQVDAVSSWSLSLTGWIAVLLLFVLARVFEHGARMRDELEGTV